MQAFKSLRRHLTSTLATFFTALVSFTLLFLLGMVLWNLDRVVLGLKQELEISAFVEAKADPQALIKTINTWPNIAEVRLQTKDQALALMQEDYPYLQQAKEFVENPLPDTIYVKMDNSTQLRDTARTLERLEGIESVEYGGKITEQLQTVLNGLCIAINILIILLLLDTFFSVMGTIRLSIENRKDELKVMQLIGATKRFIQTPFIYEGLLIAISAAATAMALGVASYRFLSTALQNVMPYVPVLANDDLIRGASALMVLALILGGMGAYLASRANMGE